MGFEIVNGARQYYGPRTVDRKNPARKSTLGRNQELELVFDYSDLPAVQLVDAVNQVIPAYAFITSARWETLIAFAGGTSYTVGLYQKDGTVVNATGLFQAADLPLANINLAGEWVIGSGAMVAPANGATNVAATGPIQNVASQIVVAATGTFTAGRARITVRYEQGFGQ